MANGMVALALFLRHVQLVFKSSKSVRSYQVSRGLPLSCLCVCICLFVEQLQFSFIFLILYFRKGRKDMFVFKSACFALTAGRVIHHLSAQMFKKCADNIRCAATSHKLTMVISLDDQMLMRAFGIISAFTSAQCHSTSNVYI